MQTIKKYWVYGLFAFAVIFFIVKRVVKHPGDPNKLYLSVKTFKTDLGWGYDVYTNDSVFIHQEYIPAIEGRKGFASETDAEQVGKLAVAKMKNKQRPMILLSDLDSMKIQR